MALGAIADDAASPDLVAIRAGDAGAARTGAEQIDADCDAVTHHRLGAVDQPLAQVQGAQRVGAENRVAAAQPQLRQPGALAHQDRKRLRADLGIERAVVAGCNAVEAAGLVGDHPGEDVKPAGGAFRIGRRRNVGGKREPLDQRHNIDAAGLQHCAARQGELVQRQLDEALRDGGPRPGQEARAHAVGGGAEPQVETCRLDLTGRERVVRADAAVRRQRGDHAVRQDSGIGR